MSAVEDHLRAVIKRAAVLYPCRHCAESGGGASMGWTSLCGRCHGSGIELHPAAGRVPLTPNRKGDDVTALQREREEAAVARLGREMEAARAARDEADRQVKRAERAARVAQHSYSQAEVKFWKAHVRTARDY